MVALQKVDRFAGPDSHYKGAQRATPTQAAKAATPPSARWATPGERALGKTPSKTPTSAFKGPSDRFGGHGTHYAAFGSFAQLVLNALARAHVESTRARTLALTTAQLHQVCP